MEYLLGSLITLISITVINFIVRQRDEPKKIKVKNSQSYLYQLLSEIAYHDMERSKKERQSDKFLNKDSVKVMIVENKAYWIKDNQLYVADYVNGDVDNYSITKVDTISMSQVELEKTMFIVEKLAEEEK